MIRGGSALQMALPISGKIDRLPSIQSQASNPLCLPTIGNAPVILAPRAFLRIAEQIWPSDMVMVADLGAAQATEISFRPIGASIVGRIAFLMVDPPNLEALMQLVP